MPVQDIGRLAMRVEGLWWVAYWTAPASSNKIEIARLRMSLAADPVLKDRFMDFCRLAMALAIKEVTGSTVAWGGPTRAPESERSGRG